MDDLSKEELLVLKLRRFRHLEGKQEDQIFILFIHIGVKVPQGYVEAIDDRYTLGQSIATSNGYRFDPGPGW